MKRLFRILCSLLLIRRVFSGPLWTDREYPNPTLNIKACGAQHPSDSSYLCDPDLVLSREAAIRVHHALDNIHDTIKSECGSDENQKGFQVAIALAERIYVPAHTSMEESIKDMAQNLHNKWGVGYQECNNGVLLLLSKNDRSMYFSVGRGTEKILTDDRLEGIMEEMKPLLMMADYDMAVETAVKEIDHYLKAGPPSFNWTSFFIIAFFVIWVGLILYEGYRGPKRQRDYAEAKKKLSLIERERAQALANNFEALSCPVCLEEFTTETQGETKIKIGSDGEPVETLRCGHQFCGGCLNEWVKTHGDCPICRKPFDSQDKGTDYSHDSNLQEERRTYIDNEILFRLLSARRFHSNFITEDAVREWTRHSATEAPLYTQDPLFTSLDPAPAATTPSSNASTFSSRPSRSFHGGQSSGGKFGSW